MAVFNCLNCGGSIKYIPGTRKVRCQYCDVENDIDAYLAGHKMEGKYEARRMNCSQCGAELIATDNTAATFCSYCGSPTLVPGAVTEETAPDYIVPFKFDEEEAKEKFRQEMSRRRFAPDWIKSNEGVSTLRGIYMPYHLIEMDYSGTFNGKAEKFSTMGAYDVHDTYALEGDLDVNYSNMCVDASETFPDNLSRPLYPFSVFDRGESFNPAYLAGFYADTADVDASVYTEPITAAAAQNMRTIRLAGPNNTSVNSGDLIRSLNGPRVKNRSALLPVWFLNFRNGDKISYAAINGETGKIAADIPVDFRKYLAASLMLAAVISVVLNIFVTVTPVTMLALCIPLIIIGLMLSSSSLDQLYRSENNLNDYGRGKKTGDKESKTKSDAPAKQRKLNWFWIVAGVVFIYQFMRAGESYIFASLSGFWLLLLTSVIAYIIGKALCSAMFGMPGPLKAQKQGLRAPMVFRLTHTWKIYAALAFALGVFFIKPVYDIWYYFACIAVLIMTAVTFAESVSIHNRLTMRDIPVFTDKRGGDVV